LVIDSIVPLSSFVFLRSHFRKVLKKNIFLKKKKDKKNLSIMMSYVGEENRDKKGYTVHQCRAVPFHLAALCC